MNYKIRIGLIFLFLHAIISLYGQSPFKASILAGVNLSQVDGDYQTGFDRKGINFGLRGGFSVNKRIDIMSELFYNEKGVKPPKLHANSITIDLTYAEIPITVNIHSKPNALGFYNWTFHTGLSYGRLLKSHTLLGFDTTGAQGSIQEAYKPNDWALVWGLSYNIRPHIGVRFQHSFSLSKFFINPIPKPAYDPRFNDNSFRTFRNYFIAFQVYYDFFAPKMKTVKKKR
jgi:hypothetical protein